MPFITQRCQTCGKLAESVKECEIGKKKILILKCGHIIASEGLDKGSPESIVSLDGKKLYPFQCDGARFIESSGGRALIADEMGLGKTVQSLSAISLHSELTPFLAIVKSSLTQQWAHETMRWCGEDFFTQIIEDSKTPLLPGLKGYIISYDLIRRYNDRRTREKASGQESPKSNRLREMMDKAGIKTVVIDEVQQIKNPESQRTVEVRELCRGIPHVIALSGTPIKNNASEYFPILNILHPEMYPRYSHFVFNEVDSYYTGYGYKSGGLKFPERFKEKTKHFIIRRERKEVMPELPLVSRQFRFCDLKSEVEEAYKSTFKLFRNEMEGNGKPQFERESNILAYLSKMRHLTGISKIDPTVDFVMEFLGGTDRKLTIFAHHKDVAEILKRKLEKLCDEIGELKPLSLTSDLDPHDRSSLVDLFMNGSQRILIASTLASGEGLNLQKCSDCIMMERQWNPANEEQAEGRFARIDQKNNKITATYFVAVGTVDEFFSEIVERKREIVTKTLGGEAVKWDQSSLIKELSEILASQGGKRWGI